MSALINLTSVELDAGQKTRVTVDPITLPSGRTLADFSSFTLTIRLDPLWPRRAFDTSLMDPFNDGWDVALTVTGSVVGITLVFDLTQLDMETLLGGINRYALDVVAEGGTAGRVRLVRARYVTVYPSVREM